MTVYHNNSEIFIDDPEAFCQYQRLLLSGHNGNTLHPNTTEYSTAQLDG